MALLIHRAAFLLRDAERLERNIDLLIEGNCSAAIGPHIATPRMCQESRQPLAP